ncbi:MAG: glycosyltransferase family 2 protein [Ferruginibacter sp.]
MSSIKVTILLATYNGGRFIRDQLDSIVQQTYSNWELLVSDDASTDEMPSIINEYATLHNDKITILPAGIKNQGSVANFNRLFNAAKESGAKYIMFCDQDDYWFPSKIEVTLNRMLLEEEQHGKAVPLLIHTNFTYADAGLKPIASKAKFHARKLRHLGLPNLIIQNPVYGCTSMFNKSLGDKISDIPSYAENHDSWIALVASAFGEIIYIPESTMLYRQHGGNISTQHDDNSMANRIKRVFFEKKNIKAVERKKIIISGFAGIYATELSREQQEMITDFLAFLNDQKPALAIANLRRGVRMQTAGQTLLFYLTAMLRR